ncbi:hypothetical protein CLV78_102527 [Aliiruegeria haliotis]|uniref:Uncharacterized protein n=1 Tax=Aliiruegeria haliotis TaxID=1280846 RepID=A0A2T0RVY1_9RHOB|nr:hypothetical protein [Aliiruegeria haliotis]PRY25349.1 hypothetical protein CLV78_102527 [Aliiruegeria haliotis]
MRVPAAAELDDFTFANGGISPSMTKNLPKTEKFLPMGHHLSHSSIVTQGREQALRDDMTHDPDTGPQPHDAEGGKDIAASPGGSTFELEEGTRRLRSGDLVISPILMLISLVFAIQSALMIHNTVSSGVSKIATSPGLFSTLTSVLIFRRSCWVCVGGHSHPRRVLIPASRRAQGVFRAMGNVRACHRCGALLRFLI